MTNHFCCSSRTLIAAALLYLLFVAEGGAAGPNYFFSFPPAAFFLFPLTLSAVVVITMLCNKDLRDAATGPMILVAIALPFTFVVSAFGGIPGLILGFAAIYIGPWILLIYAVVCLLAAGKRKEAAATELVPQAAKELSIGGSEVDLGEWKPLVRQFLSLGFTDDEIQSNLVSRGLSDNQAMDILIRYRQETQH